MNESIKLNDVCLLITDGSHYSPKSINEGYPMLSVKDMGEYDFIFDDCNRISEKDFIDLKKAGCVPQINDVLIAKDGSYLKKIFVIEEDRDIAILSSIGIIRPNPKKIDPYFVKYFLGTDYIKEQVGRKYVSGSALPRIILKNFKDIDVPDIDISIQRRIVGVLKNIDSKIAVNNRVNQKLESMLKIIYDYWFLQFEFPDEKGEPYKTSGGAMAWNEELKTSIPAEWRVDSLSNLAEITWGQCPSGKEIIKNPESPKDLIEYCSGAGDMKGGIVVDCQAYTSNGCRFAGPGDVLMSVAGKIGDICISSNNISIGRATVAITPNDLLSSGFIYLTLNKLRKQIESQSSGSIQKVFNNSNMDSIKIPYEADILDKFEAIVNPVVRQMMNNVLENRKLAEVRDFLLPLMMCGKVSVQ